MTANEIADTIIKAFKRGNFLFIIGNGGSAAEAQHMAGELVGRFRHPRKALPAIALTTDTSILTSIANDIGYEYVFSRQLDALGRQGDILLCLSTSGKSKNVLNAKEMAKIKGIECLDLNNIGEDTPSIQENHLKLIHQMCGRIEEAFI